MKRIYAITALVFAVVTAGAQTMYDGINFSTLNYSGSARSMALGNAMTAVGGDIGAIVINPAGSGVYNYSEFSFTPGLSISAVDSRYSYFGDQYFGPVQRTGNTKFDLPNVGFVLKFNTGASSGVKGWSLSFMSSQTENYFSGSYASGVNGVSSLAGELAYDSFGLSEETLDSSDPFNNSNYDWDLITAYKSGTTGSLTDGYYIGSNERLVEDDMGYYHYVPGNLRQVSSVTKSGVKNDFIINGAVNVNDRVYVGFTLGMPTLRYRYSEGYTESAVNPEEFPVNFSSKHGLITSTFYESNSMNYYYSSSCAGVYAKLGVIARITNSFRFGAAIQTPTALTVSESWQYAASAYYENATYSASSKSPVGEYTYGLITPWLFNVGLAYTFGMIGFVSVDYEMVDYSSMRFRSRYEDGSFGSFEYFRDLNDVIRRECKATNNLRVGVEIKPLPFMAVRGGYGFMTSPERSYNFENGTTSFFSFGFGFSTIGSFYADLAAKRTSYPLSAMTLYYDYDGFTREGEYVSFSAPEVSSLRKLWNVSLTLGWRF
ncbi:MAG: hypothetical protein MJY89_01605 [Bacteroidales bacterium]|nr:hypothetical protein [Bacteroidales bacterium]